MGFLINRICLGKRSSLQKDEYDVLVQAADYLKDNPKVQCNPYPDYDARVMNALGTLTGDKNYQTNYDKLKGKAIEKMSINNIATMYTFLLRGERFCDGHIASYIEDGTLLRLIRRHLELIESKNKHR